MRRQTWRRVADGLVRLMGKHRFNCDCGWAVLLEPPWHTRECDGCGNTYRLVVQKLKTREANGETSPRDD